MPVIENPQLPPGYRHIGLGDTQSTNLDCLDHLRRGDPGRLWITADRQLAGRGSRGRGWVSEPGNLYASLLLRDPAPFSRLHTLGFAASLAVRDTLIALGGGGLPPVTVKWPNDVLVGGAKICGLLLESHEADGARYAIVGIGINTAHRPGDTLYRATSLAEEGLSVSALMAFQHLAVALDTRLAQWSRGDGFAATRDDWLRAAHGLGGPIEVQMSAGSGGERFSGRFVGLDEEGLLLLAEAGGRLRKVSAADIFFA
ncbi:MAG: biotin--[acetyl-CoA-carboxylase] ligase [Nitratireductor sp.]|nr:biotin--[acetyl-CoA-carboxylase] ligase [Nitratireductor sp.]